MVFWVGLKIELYEFREKLCKIMKNISSSASDAGLEETEYNRVSLCEGFD